MTTARFPRSLFAPATVADDTAGATRAPMVASPPAGAHADLGAGLRQALASDQLVLLLSLIHISEPTRPY